MTFSRLFALFIVVMISTGVVSCRHSRDVAELTHVQETSQLDTVIGYLPYWNQSQALRTIRENSETFSEVSPFWYQLDSSGNISLFENGWYQDQGTLRTLRAMGFNIVPTLANLNGNGWDATVVSRIINNPTLRKRHIKSVVDLVTVNSYDGIDIDYEALHSRDRDAFSDFVRELASALHARNKILSVTVYAKTSEPGTGSARAYHYAAIGRAVDQVRLMVYNYHWTDSPPGPVAPIHWVERVTNFAVEEIPREKIVLGFGLYGIYWKGGRGEEIEWKRVQQLVSTFGAEVRWDSESMSPWFTYIGSDAKDHVVWFENARSIEYKLRVAKQHGVTSVQFWHLGGEDPRTWQVVQRY